MQKQEIFLGLGELGLILQYQWLTFLVHVFVTMKRLWLSTDRWNYDNRMKF